MKFNRHLFYLISTRKLLNAFLVLLSFHISRFLKRPVIWGNPLSISVEPTTSCNLKCPECPSGLKAFTRSTGNLHLNTFMNWLDQLYSDLFSITFYFQGEPYINKELLSMIAYASQKKVYTRTSTNGHFLDDANCKATIEAGLHELIISVDGTTQEVYEKYRITGELSKVLAGAERMVNWKKKLKAKYPKIIFQFLVVKPNEHQIPEIYSLAEKMGIDEVQLKSAQIYDFENGSELIPEQSVYARYKKLENGKYTIKNKLSNKCWRMWQGCVITWDGKIVPCCFDKDAQHSLGQLTEQGFSSIWKGSKYNQFRKSILQDRRDIDICKNCTEGLEVKMDF